MRPLDSLLIHQLEHLRAVFPQYRDHGGAIDLLPEFRQVGRTARWVVVTSCTVLGHEDFLSVFGNSDDTEELVRPEVAQQLTHFVDIELRGRGLHTGSMIPEGRGDVGEGVAG